MDTCFDLGLTVLSIGLDSSRPGSIARSDHARSDDMDVEMEFHSERFLAFFATVGLAYWVVRSTRLRNLLLVFASFAFYAAWNWRLAILVFGFATLDFAAALLINRAERPRVRSALLRMRRRGQPESSGLVQICKLLSC